MKSIIVDSLVGNDYSTCLSNGFNPNDIKLYLVVPQNRKVVLKKNFEVIYLSPTKDKSKNKIVKLIEYLKYLFKLNNLIKNIAPDIIHYQFFRRKSEVLFYLYLKLRGKNLVFTAHNVLPHENNIIDQLLKSIIYKTSSAIIAHSHYIKDKLIDNFKVESSKITIIPHGNFDHYIGLDVISLQEARIKLNLSINDNVLLFFGYIRKYKGLDLLINAFNRSAIKDENLKLVIAGAPFNSQMEIEYKKAINSSPFNDRIIFYCNYIPNNEVAKFFIASDLVVLPYKNIDHSGIIHLAYSFGKPVLATNVGDFNEIVENNKSGFILEQNTEVEIAERIHEIFLDKARLYLIGQYARKLSEDKYSWKDIALKTLTLYQTLRDNKF